MVVVGIGIDVFQVLARETQRIGHSDRGEMPRRVFEEDSRMPKDGLDGSYYTVVGVAAAAVADDVVGRGIGLWRGVQGIAAGGMHRPVDRRCPAMIPGYQDARPAMVLWEHGARTHSSHGCGHACVRLLDVAHSSSDSRRGYWDSTRYADSARACHNHSHLLLH